MARAQSIRLEAVRPAPETKVALAALTVASGEERPVRSPALELQEALEEMLSTAAYPAPRPASAMALGLGLMAAAGVCAAFWISLGRVLISLV